MKLRRVCLWSAIPFVMLALCTVRSMRGIAVSDRAWGIKSSENQNQADWSNIQEQLSEIVTASGERSLGSAKEIELKQREAEQLRKLDRDLMGVDEYVVQERQAIETWYAEQRIYWGQSPIIAWRNS